MSEYEGTAQRCPRCRHTFAVLADEVGMHACPSCGWGEPEDQEPEEEEEEEEEEAHRAADPHCSCGACLQAADPLPEADTLNDWPYTLAVARREGRDR